MTSSIDSIYYVYPQREFLTNIMSRNLQIIRFNEKSHVAQEIYKIFQNLSTDIGL